MPLAQRTAAVSLALSIGIVAVAIVLLIWLWYERRERDTELSEHDARHFKRQDFRRALVALILLVLAFEIFVGSPMEPIVRGRKNYAFFVIWLSAFALILGLLLLAMLDWLATRLYARRHLQQLARERLEILREEQQKDAPRDGSLNGSGAHLDDLPTP
ncbi:hypothetical protein [Singulisphaera acidiphila]|uniref:Uncharacterized protein n=1 Tax=Singulisphaera acidiphila (strain ATCC BAA-1392 / DSM 18658 / VKM B-2454 / MOB10) TaxID=886293 RepID=L0D9E2_SINAD|nr:hypothetical protein [Singulisphaera acidiphila]AGA26009.1 hypothetical protein Sinac_1630 [Singulisphaera acidiphila DSM 18658]